MKKTFVMSHPKIKLARLFEGTKHDIKKYVKRERNKTLPEGADFWDFDCKYGHTEELAEVVRLSEINKLIDEAERLELTSFYIEVMAKPANKPERDFSEDDEE